MLSLSFANDILYPIKYIYRGEVIMAFDLAVEEIYPIVSRLYAGLLRRPTKIWLMTG